MFNLDSCLDPNFCLNGGTCEVTITGARCHCTNRYQGNRCDVCSERFQGDGCVTCADGYYGDNCGQYLKARSHGAIFLCATAIQKLDCVRFILILFTRCDAICNVLIIGIACRNRTEWVWYPFMCDIAHTSLHAHGIALCEQCH